MILVYVIDFANIRFFSIHGTPTHLNACSYVMGLFGAGQVKKSNLATMEPTASLSREEYRANPRDISVMDFG